MTTILIFLYVMPLWIILPNEALPFKVFIIMVTVGIKRPIGESLRTCSNHVQTVTSGLFIKKWDDKDNII